MLEWIEEKPSQDPQDLYIDAKFEGIDMTVSMAGTAIVHSTVRGEHKTRFEWHYFYERVWGMLVLIVVLLHGVIVKRYCYRYSKIKSTHLWL